MGAQGIDEDRQSGHGGRAFATAVVHEDDGAAELRLGFHDLQLGEDRLGNFLRRLARMFVPVVGVDLAAHDDEALVLNGHDGCGLVVGLRFFVDVVRRAEVERLLQDVENLGRPLGVGTVVERYGHFIGVVAVVLDLVSTRIDVHVLVDDELFARVFLVGIDGDGALAGLGKAGDAHDVSLAFDVNVMAGLDQIERLQRFRSAGLVPDVPQ